MHLRLSNVSLLLAHAHRGKVEADKKYDLHGVGTIAPR